MVETNGKKRAKARVVIPAALHRLGKSALDSDLSILQSVRRELHVFRWIVKNDALLFIRVVTSHDSICWLSVT